MGHRGVRRIAAVVLLALPGCGRDATPAWGFDPIYLEPADDGGVYGFETWQVYSDKWVDHPKEKFYLCSVVVELTGTPSSCPGCLEAWDVTPSLVETDCPKGTEDDPVFLSLQGIGIGDPDDAPDAPYSGLTSHIWADYGFDWEDYGQGWPEVLDSGGTATDGSWDGVQAFDLWPNGVWPLGGNPTASTATATLTSASRAER